VKREGMRYDHSLGAWVMDDPPKEENKTGEGGYDGFKYYDAKTGKWVSSEPVSEVVDYTVASCEVPIRKELGPAPRSPVTSLVQFKTESPYLSGNPYPSGPKKEETKKWEPVKPWEGIDKAKWPNTVIRLILLYSEYGWHNGKYICNEDYRDRILRGIYKPEPKTWAEANGYKGPGTSARSYGPYHYPYGEYYDQEGD
jgi:hypothetical protein